MTDYTVREATAADQRAILDIYNDAVLHTTSTFDLEPRTWEAHQRWAEEHRAPYHIAVAMLEDSVVGWGSLTPFRPKPGYRFTAQDSIYVHKDFRGRGIGAALLTNLMEAARQGGFHSIVALIDGGNTVSVHLHERFGFRHVGTFPQVGFKFGRWLDIVHMQKMLE